jgi:hypothetical protein
MLHDFRPGPKSMSSAAKYRARLSQIVTSVSIKLSIAAVVGLALVPLIPLFVPAERAAPVAQASATPRPADSKVETAHPKPPPAIEARVAAGPGAVAATGPLIEANPDSAMVQLAAAKRRSKQAKREPEPEPKRTPSAIATAEPERRPSAIASAETPGKVPVPTTDAKAEPDEAEPPKPDVWSEAEVIAALKECVKLLGPIAADIEVAPAVKHEQCGAPAPVMLRRIGSGSNKVEISPPAMLNCAMVVGLHNWVEKTLQPAAQEAFGSPVARLRNASGYSCRNRNGSVFNSDKLSEHAKANAVDIAGFVTADGRSVEVARHWGQTARDIREAERLAAVRAKEAREAKNAKPEPAKAEPARAEPKRSSSAIATRQDGRSQEKNQRKDDAVRTSQLQQPGRTANDAKAVPLPPSGAGSDPVKTSAEAGFLRRLHKGACGIFGTVLGPEANEAHRDHFHFDLAARRRNSYCE